MKGVVFTEFLDFVEAKSGYETVDQIIETSNLPSGGVYTAVGKYPFSEMAELATAYAKISGMTLPECLHRFGEHLFESFARLYPVFFRDVDDPLRFIETIEDRIHIEVLKLYPDAELPSVLAKRIDADTLLINYRSCRPLGHLCLGLIERCGIHFGVRLDIAAQAAEGGLDITIRRAKAPALKDERQEAGAHP
jgi:hypothetical protein